MHRIMRKLHGLKLRRHGARMIDLNKYFALLPGAKSSYNICEMELNEILLNSITRIYIRQEYVQSFDYE